MSSFSEQEIEEFKAEAMELLDVAEKSLLALDQGSGEFKPAYDAVFRGFHNLKGASAMMELTRLAEHTHELENILIGFKGATSIPKAHISLFLRGIDAARALLNNEDIQFDFNVETPAVPSIAGTIEKPQSKPEISKEAVDEFVTECDEIVDRLSKNLQLLESNGADKTTIDSVYRDIHSLKGSAYLFSFKKLGDVSHILESSLEPVRDGSRAPSKELINGLFKGLEVIEAIVKRIKAKVSDEDLEPIIKGLSGAFQAETEQLPSVPVVQTVKSETPAAGESEAASSIRVPVALLDSLMTLMGEMVLVRNQVLQYSNQSEDLEFVSMSKRLNLVTSEIQGEMMKTRMQPIGNVLSKFNRVVRDLSQDLKKSITLTLTGVETELDKSLLEAIKDPLTHIVRNSCDHGIESPADRKKSSKPETGHINIRAYHEGGQVIIDVVDDGKGLHKDMIIKKALERNLISQAQAAKMSEKEIFNLIFAPGFSTAAKITNVSGRGVGMDVVRTNIEKIGGTVDLTSVAGKGTTIKLKIPLTLAIVPALMVKCGEGTFAIPQVKLEELVRVDQSNSESKIEILHGMPVYRLRGNILPLVDLGEILRLGQGSKAGYQQGTFNIAVVNAEQTSFGLIIDEVKDTADIVVKPLNRLLKSLKVYSGATILGDGSVSLILDIPGIAKVAHLNQQRAKTQDLAAGADRGKINEVQDYLLVKLGTPTKHAIVLGLVHRLEEFSRKQVEISGAQPVIRYRNAILPLIYANELLGYSNNEPKDDLVSVVVIKRAGSLYGIVVDSILDTLSTPAELEAGHAKQVGIFGCMDSGEELIVVIDPFELISKAFPSAFPVETKPATPSVEPVVAFPKRGSSSRGRILLAEDTLFFRKAIKKVLEGRGFEVVTANDGKEAIDMLDRGEGPFDLIVSDIEMPRVNGFQLAEGVRKHPKFSSTPMLALSSRADREYMLEGQRVGFDLYLEKIKPANLLAAVNELTTKRKRVS